MICQRLKVTRKRLNQSSDDEAQTLFQAEKILAIDGGNGRARDLAIEGYTYQVSRGLENISQSRQHKKDEASGVNKLPPGKRRRLRAALRRSVRRLRHHLNNLHFAPSPDIKVFSDGYENLYWYYFYMGDYQSALKMIGRARRLKPEDDKLRAWARLARKARRGG